MKRLTINFRLFLLTCAVCLVFAGSGCAPAPKTTSQTTTQATSPTPPPTIPQTASRNEPPQRLISTAPSITELLFDIGIGDRIVG
ncbi:MAG: hypothetical protein LBC02_08855, partial [Planctomycetaceae bacterium]|nr:hypothetical protein [Planctomycetaceae bacterium]